MCGFSVHSDGEATISLWFDNGVQEEDGSILIVVLHRKPDGRVDTVNVLKEVLFADLLVDDKDVIHNPVPEPRGWRQYLELFVPSTPYTG